MANLSKVIICTHDPLLASRWEAQVQTKFTVCQVSELENLTSYLTPDTQTVLMIHGEPFKNSLRSLNNVFQPQLKILILGQHWPENLQIEALINGCSGYCDVNSNETLLIKAIDCLSKGDTWIPRHLVPRVISELTKFKQNHHSAELTKTVDASHPLNVLTAREMEVAQLIAKGENNKRIAAMLNISERTVKAHLTSIFSKLKILDRLHLALYIKEVTDKQSSN
ncbi:response regulator transcription factor [Methylicorpusculum sp.]|uniref:response regulator transcription factor n=1 Tax=Methylicorpusculum sp. TaxID=2713644 RepID=UPI00271DC02E|nr:response regulator transcription factor [Methylicorpusculum sp.]MDO8844895.1 response regulator transcription factor [Methylicorpusculum sp.]